LTIELPHVDRVPPTKRLRVIASVFGVTLLVALVTVVAAIFDSGKGFWFLAIAGYLFTVPFAIPAWHGNFFGKEDGPRTPTEWLQFFAGSAVLSGVFVAIDVAIKHPGFSLVFTLGALVMTFIALPGAARAWLLEFLSARERDGENDAS
jgi:hypothetical protein